MKKNLTYIKEKPTVSGIIGWVLFPGMYLSVGVLTMFFNVEVRTAFTISAPFGIAGILLWIASVIFGINNLRYRKNVTGSIVALILGLLPLLFISFGLYIALFMGGV